jgi:hypothetical protein
MLVLRRKEGQWVEITHHSGDRMLIRVYNIRCRFPGQIDMAFDDPDHHFNIQRGDRSWPRRSPRLRGPLSSRVKPEAPAKGF